MGENLRCHPQQLVRRSLRETSQLVVAAETASTVANIATARISLFGVNWPEDGVGPDFGCDDIARYNQNMA